MSARGFVRDQRGNVMLTFAIVLPVLLGAAAIAVDYSFAASTRTRMQAVADAAALSAARELQMAQTNSDKVAAVAQNYVKSRMSEVSAKTKVDTGALTVQVDLDMDYDLKFGTVVSANKVHLHASATAKMSSGLPLCLLGLDPRTAGTITLQKNARLTAPGCSVYSDSKSPQGLVSKDDAVLRAGSICSAGGKVKSKDSNYSPQPMTDCPVIADPLASREGPANFNCSYHDKVVDGSTATLSPGVYCGGLVITHRAQVTLGSGIFVIKDGPLIVNGGSSLKGANVAIYMKGTGANLTFAPSSTINLTAPKDGPLAGILIFDDPSGTAAPERPARHDKAGKSPREHSILSDDARVLLGTIYLPKGRLIIDATRPIADRSAYTVLVVQQLDLYDGPNLYLNSDYGATEIPVPKGVGPYGAPVMLTN